MINIALKPYQLAEIPKNIVKLYEDLEDFIIQDVCKRISKAGVITETGQWQLNRATDFGYNMDIIKEEIRKTLKLSNKEIDELFKEAAIKSIKQDNAIYEQAKLTPIHYNQSEQLQQYLAAAVKQTKGKFKNITQTLGFVLHRNGKRKFKKLSQAYVDTLNFASMQVNSGVCNYQTAIRNAVKSLADSGIRTINYESGWANRLDVAVRRATLTGANQMSLQMTDYMHNKIVPQDEQYVEVTAHSGARPSHQVWQGQVYKVNGSTSEYDNLYEATGLGTGPGLGGWNCRHSYFPFIPDVSIRTYTDKQLKNIDPEPFNYNGKTYTYYEATQMQRKMETNIRATKREIIGYNAANDKEAFTNASIKLQQQKKAYKNFSNAAGIRVKNERHQVYQYGKSISQKSVWSNKKSTGGIGKIHKNDYARKQKHANIYYESIRKRNDDIVSIARNTGINENTIRKIKEHIFINKYNLAEGYVNFYPDYEMSLAWQRLIEGKYIRKSDIVLLHHERLESYLMDRYNYSYEEAHKITCRKYNYVEALKED